MVPDGTTAMVNMWVITHDESVWFEWDAELQMGCTCFSGSVDLFECLMLYLEMKKLLVCKVEVKV